MSTPARVLLVTTSTPSYEKVVRDGNLITGQNPTSAAAVGKQVAKRLARRKNAPRD